MINVKRMAEKVSLKAQPYPARRNTSSNCTYSMLRFQRILCPLNKE